MEVLSGPLADLTLFLRQTVTPSDGRTDGFLPVWLFWMLLFLSVCLLLLQLIVCLSWKLTQAEADLSEYQQDRSSIYRRPSRNTHLRRTRSVGAHSGS